MLKKGFDEFPAGKKASWLLPNILKGIKNSHEKRIGDVSKIWDEIVGQKYAHLTKVLKLESDILYVKVLSTSLYALFSTQEKARLEREIQKKISFVKIKTIVFRR